MWLSAFSVYLVGTTSGAVYEVSVNEADNKMESKNLTEEILGYEMASNIINFMISLYMSRKCQTHAGEVVCIVEQPLSDEKKVTVHAYRILLHILLRTPLNKGD